MIRFLHAADLHLDSPLRGLERYEGAPVEAIRQASRRSLEKLVALAIAERVHFVLFAGDIYDGAWEDVHTGLFFVGQMARLQQRDIRVFLISGNHDAANKMTRRLPYPDNVFQFPTEQSGTVTLDDQRVAIHGQSYAEEKETRNIATGYPIPIPGCLNIGLLHTCLDGREGHARYAPCALEELIARNYDYWALGHIHQRESVNRERWPCVEFPGNIQGRDIGETGPKGCLLVHADSARNLTPEFRALDVFRWHRAPVDCSRAADRENLLQRVSDALDDAKREGEGRPVAVRVELMLDGELPERLLGEERQLRDDIRALALSQGEGMVWVEKIQLPPNRRRTGEVEPALADDALSELTALIDSLRGDPAALALLLDVEEVKHLNGRLPSELRHGEAAMNLADPTRAAALLDRAQAILTSATTKEPTR